MGLPEEHEDVGELFFGKEELFAPCPYCTGVYTGLPGNACENCMDSGYKHNGPEYEEARKRCAVQH